MKNTNQNDFYKGLFLEWQKNKQQGFFDKPKNCLNHLDKKPDYSSEVEIKSNVESYYSVIERIRKEFKLNNKEFTSNNDLNNQFINKILFRKVMNVMRNGVFPLVEKGIINPRLKVGIVGENNTFAKSDNSIVYATNSSNPPVWGHILAALQALAFTGSSKIIIYTGWSSGHSFKSNLAPIDKRLYFNDLVEDLLSPFAVHTKNLTQFKFPNGLTNNRGGISPIKIFLLNRHVKKFYVAKGMDHIDDIDVIYKDCIEYGVDPKKIGFLFTPRPGFQSSTNATLHEKEQHFDLMEVLNNPLIMSSSTMFRDKNILALCPYRIRKKWEQMKSIES